MYVQDIHHDLWYEGQVALLSLWPGLRNFRYSMNQGFMTHKRCENTSFQKETKVSYCQVQREQLSAHMSEAANWKMQGVAKHHLPAVCVQHPPEQHSQVS